MIYFIHNTSAPAPPLGQKLWGFSPPKTKIWKWGGWMEGRVVNCFVRVCHDQRGRGACWNTKLNNPNISLSNFERLPAKFDTENGLLLLLLMLLVCFREQRKARTEPLSYVYFPRLFLCGFVVKEVGNTGESSCWKFRMGCLITVLQFCTFLFMYVIFAFVQ